jgi:hypothetical protein
MTDAKLLEYALRVTELTKAPRLMTVRAAVVVVEAAMFGHGCIEGEVRERVASTGSYWCCAADFGEHEPTCPNWGKP